MIMPRLKEYLDGHQHVHSYEVLPHPETHQAPDLDRTLHVPEKELAKVVIVKVNEWFVVTVLPADWKVDVKRQRGVQNETGATRSRG